jgi:hypothetical protein
MASFVEEENMTLKEHIASISSNTAVVVELEGQEIGDSGAAEIAQALLVSEQVASLYSFSSPF